MVLIGCSAGDEVDELTVFGAKSGAVVGRARATKMWGASSPRLDVACPTTTRRDMDTNMYL